jgi:hypothetical protein
MSSKKRLYPSGQTCARERWMSPSDKKTDLNIALTSLERSEYRRVTALNFAIKVKTKSKGEPTG